MTKKEKLKKLEKLDMLVLDKMIEFIETGQIERLPELATPSNYLAKNNMVEDKRKSTVEEDIKKRIEEAKRRRESGNEV